MRAHYWIPPIAIALLGMAPKMALAQAPRPSRFEFVLREQALTSAGVFDARGRLVRTLWTVRPTRSGRHVETWDGRDEFGTPARGSGFEFRVVANRGTYQNVGIVGNDGNDPASHTPGEMKSIAMDADESVYTANGWEEAGADFKKWDRNGRPVYDAGFQIRNGDPNGTPYAIAVDDRYLYCSVEGWPRAPFNAKQQIQRFRLSDGRHEPFPGLERDAGHIQLYEWPERQIPRGTPESDLPLLKAPLRALAVAGERLYVCDALGDKVHMFDKGTGAPRGELRVKLPTAIAVMADGVVWVGHEHYKLSTFAPGETSPKLVVSDFGDVKGMALGPANRLYVADGGTSQVKIYELGSGTAKLIGGFGRRAVPGDSAPERFYDLRGVAVDRRGGFATIQTLPLGGARLSRWSVRGELLWDRLGLEFVSLGTYARTAPDDFISLQLNRYRLFRQGEPRAEFRGNLLDGDRRYQADVHGVPRLVKIGKTELFYSAQGDGMQVFRREGDPFRRSAMVGGRWPTPDGRHDEKGPLGQWTWHDANGDGTVDREEILWYRRSGQGKYAVVGMSADERGNLLYCDQDTKAIWEMPVLGVDSRDNPRYDWARARIIVPRDTSRARLSPLMAVRAPDGRLYAFGRSEAWKQPKNAGAWMGGWALAAYDPRGTMLWSTPLPEVCVGMDAIPGGGVLLGWYEKGHIFHYNSDGLHIGTARPGPASGGVTGWLDNTAALAANRDPRDGLIDVFTSDNYLYRILWYRIDDRRLETIRGRIQP